MDRQFHILFMPKNSEACCRKLKELNVFGSFTHIESFGANLLPLDTDLLTLNNPRCVKVRTPAAEAHLCFGCLYFEYGNWVLWASGFPEFGHLFFIRESSDM